jgi:hypothetical protein
MEGSTMARVLVVVKGLTGFMFGLKPTGVRGLTGAVNAAKVGIWFSFSKIFAGIVTKMLLRLRGGLLLEITGLSFTGLSFPVLSVTRTRLCLLPGIVVTRMRFGKPGLKSWWKKAIRPC